MRRKEGKACAGLKKMLSLLLLLQAQLRSALCSFMSLALNTVRVERTIERALSSSSSSAWLQEREKERD